VPELRIRSSGTYRPRPVARCSVRIASGLERGPQRFEFRLPEPGAEVADPAQHVRRFEVRLRTGRVDEARRLAAWLAVATGVQVPPILILTTFALVLAQFEFVAPIRGEQVLGMFGAICFLPRWAPTVKWRPCGRWGGSASGCCCLSRSCWRCTAR